MKRKLTSVGADCGACVKSVFILPAAYVNHTCGSLYAHIHLHCGTDVPIDVAFCVCNMSALPRNVLHYSLGGSLQLYAYIIRPIFAFMAIKRCCRWVFLLFSIHVGCCFHIFAAAVALQVLHTRLILRPDFSHRNCGLKTPSPLSICSWQALPPNPQLIHTY